MVGSRRAHDETPAEYGQRLAEDVANNPDKYFARYDVVRTERDERESAFDVWQTASAIREGRRIGAHPRNPDACLRFGRPCEFFGVCTGTESLDNPLIFKTRPSKVAQEAA